MNSEQGGGSITAMGVVNFQVPTSLLCGPFTLSWCHPSASAVAIAETRMKNHGPPGITWYRRLLILAASTEYTNELRGTKEC